MNETVIPRERAEEAVRPQMTAQTTVHAGTPEPSSPAIEAGEVHAWAGERLDVTDIETVAERPWGRSWRVRHADGVAWLKCVPPVLAPVVATTARLAERFPERVPAVLAHDARRGLLLVADHGGRDLGRRPDEGLRVRLLRASATVEAGAVSVPKLLEGLPRRASGALLDDLLAFLDPGGAPAELEGSRVTADHFLSPERCRAYRHHVEACAPTLRRYLARADALPPTVQHGDLRPSNAARGRRGGIVLYDWEEAFAGPAGASLHALFGGCATLLRVLDDDPGGVDPEELRQTRRELEEWLDALVAEGYAGREALLAGVGAAALGGMLRYIVSFGRFPCDGRSQRHTVRRNLKRRLSDLLDVCEHLSLHDPLDPDGEGVRRLAESFVAGERPWRSESLLACHLARRPDDVPAQLLRGAVLATVGRTEGAARAYGEALETAPDSVEALVGLARCEALEGRLDAAVRRLRAALALGEDRALRARLERLHTLRWSEEEAERSGVVPTVAPSEAERSDGAFAPETVALCDRLMRRHGVLLLRGVFDPASLERCRERFVERYRHYLENRRHEDALRIGDKRLQVTIDLEPPFDAPSLYANPFVLEPMRRLLGRDCVLGCFTAAVSLPGAEDQRLHKDHKALFGDDPEARPLPSFAITTMVPLVDIDERVGTTRVKKGSHLLESESSAALPYQTPRARLGDCYLMDYRLSHHGQANRSRRARPILSLVYRRPWFRDYINFHDQPSLRLSAEAYARLPERLRGLLAWTAEPGPR